MAVAAAAFATRLCVPRTVILTTAIMALFLRSSVSAFLPLASSGRRVLRSTTTTTTTCGQRVAAVTTTRSRLYSSSSSSATKSSLHSNEYGVDMDQNAMMESDMLITVDSNDLLVELPDGSKCSKKQAHIFNEEQPRGLLHRAFSFFLFDSEGRMLLTQRAGSKITFPNVWTNTCCSHPLYGMQPEEVDVTPAAYPHFPGAKHAAIRKLKHELGIEKRYLEHKDIQFISRFQYWAADTITYGSNAPWGEHEVDYILFLQCQHEVPVHANPEEVSSYKYVSIDELKSMMYDEEHSDLLWSPWFRGIMERGGFDWWADLPGALAGDYTNPDVTFFDPPKEHVAKFNLPSHTSQTGVLSRKVEN